MMHSYFIPVVYIKISRFPMYHVTLTRRPTSVRFIGARWPRKTPNLWRNRGRDQDVGRRSRTFAPRKCDWSFCENADFYYFFNFFFNGVWEGFRVARISCSTESEKA